jgi:hypothetical protein
VLPARCTFALRYPKLEQTDSFGRDRVTQGTAFDVRRGRCGFTQPSGDTSATMVADMDAVASSLPPNASSRSTDQGSPGSQNRYNLALQAGFCSGYCEQGEDFDENSSAARCKAGIGFAADAKRDRLRGI